MKLLLWLIGLIFITRSRAEDQQKSPRSCDTDCNDHRTPVCGYNGQCYAIFKTECRMKRLNCKRVNEAPFKKRFQFGDCLVIDVEKCEAWKMEMEIKKLRQQKENESTLKTKKPRDEPEEVTEPQGGDE